MSIPRWTHQIKNLFSPSAKVPDTRPTKVINITPLKDEDDDSLEIPLEQYEDTIENNQPQMEHHSEVIHHILSNLLKETNFPGPIYKASTAMGYKDPVDFAIINLQEMQELNPQLTPGNWRNLQDLQEYYFHLMETYEIDHLDNIQWLHIKYADIKALQVQNSRNRHINNMVQSPSTSTQNEFTSTPVTPTQGTNNMATIPTISLNNTPVTTTQGTQHQDVPRAKSIRESIKMG